MRLLLLLITLLLPHPARASGDFACSPRWTLVQREWSPCNNLAFLSPGNDSRVNLQLLLIDAGKAILEPAPKDAPPAKPPLEGAAPFSLQQLDAALGPHKAEAASESPDQSDEEIGLGTRCNSDAGGTEDFTAALGDTPALPAAEHDALAAARKGLKPTCDEGKPALFQPPAMTSAPGRQFADYLSGAAAFYQGDWEAATRLFAGLAGSDQPWLKEAARYMAGRVALNRAASAAFDEYGILDRKKVDRAALDAAEAGFRAYLKDYPAGRYTESARGLLRRVDWLGDRPQRLAAQLAAELNRSAPAEDQAGEIALVEEADLKLLREAKPEAVRAPLILATLDLMAMRGDKLDAAALAAQQPAFEHRPELYEYLLAARAFYLDHDPAAALSHLPGDPPKGPAGFLGFSRQVLRGLALEAKGDRAAAREAWLALVPLARPPLQRPALDLALAWNEERDQALDRVFATDSPVQDRAVREVLIDYAAGPALLAARVKAEDAPGRERRVARYVLLYKDLLRGRYGAFAQDAALVAPGAPDPADAESVVGGEPDAAIFQWQGGAESDDDYACPPIAEIARALAKDPRQPRGLICLAEFRRLNGLDYAPLDTPPPPDQLGGAPSGFPGAVLSRMAAYQQVLGNDGASAGEKAYALYRAINCYAPAGITECGSPDVPSSQRKQWFRTLKTTYARTRWGRALKFYW